MKNSIRHSPRRLCAALVTAALVLLAAAPAALAASAELWTIAETKGEVRVLRTGASPVALTDGDRLRPGDRIETGPGSHVLLVRGKESIMVSPNSRMGLPAVNNGGFATRILQQVGVLLLKVEKQPQHHFEVQTPYLAVVVKGTTFSVSVDAGGTAVHVVEGLVQVSDLAGRTALIRPGQTARGAADGGGISLHGGGSSLPAQQSEAEPRQGSADGKEAAFAPAPSGSAGIGAAKPFAISVAIGSEIDIKAATNGLIRAGGTQQVLGQEDGAAAKMSAVAGLVANGAAAASAGSSSALGTATVSAGTTTTTSLTSSVSAPSSPTLSGSVTAPSTSPSSGGGLISSTLSTTTSVVQGTVSTVGTVTGGLLGPGK